MSSPWPLVKVLVGDISRSNRRRGVQLPASQARRMMDSPLRNVPIFRTAELGYIGITDTRTNVLRPSFRKALEYPMHVCATVSAGRKP